MGTISKGGNIISSPYSGRSEGEILHIARQLSRQQPIKIIVNIKGSYQEPTWGDFTKLNRITLGLGTTNTSTLLSAFGSGVILIDLQMCRNCCAHLSSDGIGDIKRIKVKYNNSSFQHPSDAAYWTDPVTGDFLWKSWIDEMKIISSAAVR